MLIQQKVQADLRKAQEKVDQRFREKVSSSLAVENKAALEQRAIHFNVGPKTNMGPRRGAPVASGASLGIIVPTEEIIARLWKKYHWNKCRNGMELAKPNEGLAPLGVCELR